jgi:hypothetical protein
MSKFKQIKQWTQGKILAVDDKTTRDPQNSMRQQDIHLRNTEGAPLNGQQYQSIRTTGEFRPVKSALNLSLSSTVSYKRDSANK